MTCITCMTILPPTRVKSRRKSRPLLWIAVSADAATTWKEYPAKPLILKGGETRNCQTSKNRPSTSRTPAYGPATEAGAHVESRRKVVSACRPTRVGFASTASLSGLFSMQFTAAQCSTVTIRWVCLHSALPIRETSEFAILSRNGLFRHANR